MFWSHVQISFQMSWDWKNVCVKVYKSDGKGKGGELKKRSKCFLTWKPFWINPMMFPSQIFEFVIVHLPDMCQLEDCLVSKTVSLCQVLKLSLTCHHSKSLWFQCLLGTWFLHFFFLIWLIWNFFSLSTIPLNYCQEGKETWGFGFSVLECLIFTTSPCWYLPPWISEPAARRTWPSSSLLAPL